MSGSRSENVLSGYLILERRVLLPEGVVLLPQAGVHGRPATLLPSQLLLQGAELLPQGLKTRRSMAPVNDPLSSDFAR